MTKRHNHATPMKVPNGTRPTSAASLGSGLLTLNGAPFVPGRTVAAILKLLNGLPATEVLSTRELASRLGMRPHTLTEARRNYRILLLSSLRWGKLVLWARPEVLAAASKLIAAQNEGGGV